MRKRTTALAAPISPPLWRRGRRARRPYQSGHRQDDQSRPQRADRPGDNHGTTGGLDVSPDQLIALKKDGVPDAIIAEMAKKASGKAGPPTARSGAGSRAPGRNGRESAAERPHKLEQAKVDDPVYFEVAEDVAADGVTVLPVGSLAGGRSSRSTRARASAVAAS